MAKVNAQLAAQEKEDRASRRDCRAEPDKGRPRGTWATRTRVAYLSPRFLSVQAVSDYDCGGPYPNDGVTTPLTYDLTTGAAVDWPKLFKPGFITSVGDEEKAPPLARLYGARYPKGVIADCKDLMSAEGGFAASFTLWLDRKRGLMVKPDFNHAMQACAEEVALPPAALTRYIRDPAVLADLKATTGK